MQIACQSFHKIKTVRLKDNSFSNNILSLKKRNFTHIPNLSSFRSIKQFSLPSSSSLVKMTPCQVGPKLWSSIQETYHKAEKNKNSFKFDTKVEVLEDPHKRVDFVLRISTALKAKKTNVSSSTTATASTAPPKNPFLPPEPELLVCQLGDQHNLILNKFNVVPYHVIVTTTEFRSQEEPLHVADLKALWQVLEAFPGDAVGFYNCGQNSGRSQPHKHMQAVPLPFSPEFPSAGHLHRAVDRDSVEYGLPYNTPFAVQSLPYCCFAVKFKPGERPSPEALGQLFHRLRLRAAVSLHASDSARDSSSYGPSYNFLLTRRFMMLVPRRSEFAGPVALNSLQYAGTFFVRNEEELQYVKSTGPFAMLVQAGVDWTTAMQNAQVALKEVSEGETEGKAEQERKEAAKEVAGLRLRRLAVRKTEVRPAEGGRGSKL